MKKKILVLLLVFVSILVYGQNVEVGGLQSGVWDADIVHVVGDVKVVDSLVVASGTVVLFDGFYSVTVADGASFKAQGTSNDSIRFTVADTTGFHIYNAGKGAWNGFHIEKAGKVCFDYCILEYSKASDTTDMYGGAMKINYCDDVEISHSTLRYNGAREHGGAVDAQNSHVVMTNCNVNNNRLFSDDNIYFRYGGALRFLKCDVEMRVMEFSRNYGETSIGGALSLDSCSVVLDRAVFADNVGLNGGGLYMMRSNHLPGRLSNLLFDHNFSGHFGGGLAFSDASPEVYNILVTNNNSEGVNCPGIFFYQYASPKLTNCIVYGNYLTPPEITSDTVQADTVQMWLWTFDDYAPEFRNCLIEGGEKYITNSDYIKVFENIVDADPLFVDADHRDFRLSEGSPCRDAGYEMLPDDLAEGRDLAGSWRVANQRIDIGPYEYTGASVSAYPDRQHARLVGNPLNAQSRVEFDHEMDGELIVAVYSMTGREASRGFFDLGKSTSLEIGSLTEHLVPGVYLIEVKSSQESFTLKAVR